MRSIAVSETIFESMTKLAEDRGESIEQLLSELLAQGQWEEHAARAYDAYHSRPDQPHEALTEEEFFQSLRKDSSPTRGTSDADV